jgi:hypothetical protein
MKEYVGVELQLHLFLSLAIHWVEHGQLYDPDPVPAVTLPPTFVGCKALEGPSGYCDEGHNCWSGLVLKAGPLFVRPIDYSLYYVSYAGFCDVSWRQLSSPLFVWK